MSEEMMNHGHAGHETEFEHEDLSTRGVFVFMIGLAIVGLVIYFIIVGMYSFLDKYEHAQMKTASPLVTSTGPAARVVTKEYLEKFGENGAPMLESDERGQFKDYLMKQEVQLSTYGMDETSGVAHIPIERAMDLIVERKLPVLPRGATGDLISNASAAKTPAKRAAAQKR
jgi:hypothetical protein